MKAIDEAAKDYALKFKTQVSSEGLENIADDFKAGAEFAQRWIPVEEELPEKLTDVILRCNYEGEYLYSIGFLHDGFFRTKNSQPTHWRPIELP